MSKVTALEAELGRAQLMLMQYAQIVLEMRHQNEVHAPALPAKLADLRAAIAARGAHGSSFAYDEAPGSPAVAGELGRLRLLKDSF